MATKIEKILQDALAMTAAEKAAIAHCLISSIDGPPDHHAEEEWLKLAEKRAAELESGQVRAVSWDDIKKKIQAS